MPAPTPYALTLTANEYRSAKFMCSRGYLGGLTEHATDTDVQDDGSVILRFRESDIWPVCDAYNGDENDRRDFWALTNPSTPLGRKVVDLLNSVI